MADSNSTSGPTLPRTSAISASNPHTSLAQSQDTGVGGSSNSLSSGTRTGPQSAPGISDTAVPDAPGLLQRSPPMGRSRGKSISVTTSAMSAVNIFRPSPSAPKQADTATPPSTLLEVHLTLQRPETPAPTPSSQLLALPRSPVSPHRAKPRRGIPEELTSECSESSSAESISNQRGDSSDHICTAHAHADRGLHRHPTPDDEPGAGGCSTDSDSLKIESDNGVAETESAAGSTMTEAGSSAPTDSISDCSNSDVEIYLESHGLDDSAMRMNCVGQNSFTEDKRIGVESPALPPIVLESHGDAKQGIAVHKLAQAKVERGDTEGWVTSSVNSSTNQQPQKHVSSINHKDPVQPTVQDGDLVKLSAGGQEGRNHTSGQLRVSAPVENKRSPQDVNSPSVSDQSSAGDQHVQRPRGASELKPTSVDFKPRMAIELKPPLVEFSPTGIEFNPAHVTFAPDRPVTDRTLPLTATTTTRTYPQPDVDHSFQSNRATILDHGFHVQDEEPCRRGNTVYLDQLQPSVTRTLTASDPPPQEASEAPEGSQRQHSFDDSHKTPNVYINGLPPHFPEDQLYALAAPFGEVRSVRTFTRHVRDSESGYGFVLFENIESAERCIVALRKYRNLHPTFSKQIHKIPGTIYAQSFSQAPSESMTSLDSWDSKRDEVDSFKRRMESLHDPTSTNLYMEGLPLSIDEPTLAALVSPHRISSSRFFQTRLSHPPRIIAFVRLETRTGAEEIIERLHGRMVRGWNDTGSRISVRFADTAEQRELRRTERASNEGDTTTSRLTIAQAALLNLRGQEIRQAAKINSLPVIGERRRSDYSYNDFSSNGIQFPAPQMARPVFEVDYTLAPGRSLPAQRIQSPGMIQPGHSQQFGRPLPRSIDPSMAILLDNIRNNNPSFRGPGPSHYDNYPQQHSLAFQNQAYTPDDYNMRPPPAQAKSGYTATEEFIMRAHAESRRRPTPTSLDVALNARSRRENELEAATANIATGVRGYRTRAAAVSLDRKGQPSTLAEIEPLSMMNEDDFHANVGRGHEEQLQTTDQHHNQHVRSTTFPHRPAPNQHQRHQQHNSMSVPIGNKLHSKLQHTSSVTSLNQNAYDIDNQASPSLISPTLTYSSQSPSTLSPATPFFGSFNSQNDGFSQGNGLDGRKLRATGH
ncbi:Sporulation-specific protein 5 [Leucoagaricus sp. SymC.cos]|nr:Sporulation-specific protein 5 [Leucoagaricus sp. SymC.cos]